MTNTYTDSELEALNAAIKLPDDVAVRLAIYDALPTDLAEALDVWELHQEWLAMQTEDDEDDD
jgi:hypothetical protein